MDLLKVGRIVGIDERPDAHDHVARADLFLRQDVPAGLVDRGERILVLIDYLHRHEPLARVGERDGRRTGIEIDNDCGIKGVPVHAYDGLRVDVRHLAMVLELAKSAFFQSHRAEV